MKNVTLNGHRLSFYDAIEDLSISQFHKYSKYMLVEGGIGDSIESIDAHINKIGEFIKVDAEKAMRELMNLRQCIYMVANEQDIANKAMLCLVKEVDGKKWEDFSDGGIDELYRMVCGEQMRAFYKLRKEVLEKIDAELKIYFPSLFVGTDERNKLELMRKRALLQLAQITEGVNNNEEIAKLTSQIMQCEDVKSFEGTNSAEVEFDRQFEEMCLVLSKEFGGGIKNYSVMEFYSAYMKLEKDAKELQKLKKRK